MVDSALFEYLETFLSESRKARLLEVLALRTQHITIVLDGIYQAHNISAALRGCDAFGLQDVHLVENEHHLELSADIAGGSDKWLTLHRYRGPGAAAECLNRLKQSGFRLAITAPGSGSVTPETVPIDQPLAIVIGRETGQISPEFRTAADFRMTIPMFGFVESFNLSVASALLLQDLSRRLRASPIAWPLTDEHREELHFQWTRASIANVRAIESRWLRERELSTRSSPAPENTKSPQPARTSKAP